MTVVAFVDKIEGNAFQDFITDGSVISWTVVTFATVDPELEWVVTVQAYCAGHPFLEDAPLLIGQAVSFTLPPEARRVGIPLEQLVKLKRVR